LYVILQLLQNTALDTIHLVINPESIGFLGISLGVTTLRWTATKHGSTLPAYFLVNCLTSHCLWNWTVMHSKTCGCIMICARWRCDGHETSASDA